MSFLPVKVNAVLAISKEETANNIKTNMEQIPVWFDRAFYPNGFEAIICSAGPSLEKYVTEMNLKERMVHPNRSFLVFCVKHALPRLQAMGIEPDFCVILDGRPFDGESTHGINRKELFEKIPEKTIFLIASMSHHGYAKYLIDHGARVMGWHTEVEALKDFMHLIKEPVISGGTSSGTRSIAIAHSLGIRDVTLVGFDSCIHNPTPEQLKEKDKKGRVKYMPVELAISKMAPEDLQKINEALKVSTAGFDKDIVIKASAFKRFYTTGELMAQAQDFENLFKAPQFDIRYTVHDDGLVSHIFNNMPIPKRDNSFLSFFKEKLPKKNSTGDVKKRSVTLSDGDPEPVK